MSAPTYDWYGPLRAAAGTSLRTITGVPVTLSKVSEAGLVFTTAAGRETEPVPLAEFDRALQDLRRGRDLSQPWRLERFCKVSYASYVWAILHDRGLVERLAPPPTIMSLPAPSGGPAFRIAPDGQAYLVTTRYGIGDPRLAQAGARWDDDEGAWRIPRTAQDLRRAQALTPEELPGGRRPDFPFAVEAGRWVLLFSPYADRERTREIPGGRWLDDERCWRYPATAAAVAAMLRVFGDRLVIAPALRALADEGVPETELGAIREEQQGGAEVLEVAVPPAVDEASPAPGEALVAPPEGPEAEAEPDAVPAAELAPIPEAETAAVAEETAAVAEEPAVETPIERAPLPWSCRDGRPPLAAWLAGDLTALVLPTGLPEDAAGAEAAALAAAVGDWQGARELAEGVCGEEPSEAVVALAALACAHLGLHSPAALHTVAFAAIDDAALLPAGVVERLAREAGPTAGGLAEDLAVPALTALACARTDGRALDAWVAAVPESSPAHSRTLLLAARARSQGRAPDRAPSPAAVALLTGAATLREFADLIAAAYQYNQTAFADALLRHGYRMALSGGAVGNVEAEVLDVIAAASGIGCPATPALASAAATLIEDRQGDGGYLPAADLHAVFETALAVALEYEAGSLVEDAWWRLVRWQRERGDFEALIELAGRVRFRLRLQVAAEAEAAYALAARGETVAAVEQLAGAIARLAAVHPADAAQLGDEARLLAGGDEHLLARIPSLPSDGVAAGEALPRWPPNTEVVIAGGTDRLRALAEGELQRSGIVARWFTTEEAKHGPHFPASIQGRADFVVLLVRHIPHSITYRAERVAGGRAIYSYPLAGVARLPRFLIEAAHGRSEPYQPTGS